MTVERGAVRVEEAYAQSKMLDNSAWAKEPHALPRRITPSDIDMIFDNMSHGGATLICELSTQATNWGDIAFGQRLAYENIVRRGRTLAVLLYHAVPRNMQIDTKGDILVFQVMGQDCGNPAYSPVFFGAGWPLFVSDWYADSAEVSVVLAMNGKKTPPINACEYSRITRSPACPA